MLNYLHVYQVELQTAPVYQYKLVKIIIHLNIKLLFNLL